MIERWGQLGIGIGALMLASTFAGCSALTGGHVDCNIVRLQSQSGRSNAEIAQAIGASESDVAACPSSSASSGGGGGGGSGPPNASEYGIPPELQQGGGDSGGASAPSGGASAPSGGGDSGAAPPSP